MNTPLAGMLRYNRWVTLTLLEALPAWPGFETPDLDGWSYAAARGFGAPISE